MLKALAKRSTSIFRKIALFELLSFEFQGGAKVHEFALGLLDICFDLGSCFRCLVGVCALVYEKLESMFNGKYCGEDTLFHETSPLSISKARADCGEKWFFSSVLIMFLRHYSLRKAAHIWRLRRDLFNAEKCNGSEPRLPKPRCISDDLATRLQPSLTSPIFGNILGTDRRCNRTTYLLVEIPIGPSLK